MALTPEEIREYQKHCPVPLQLAKLEKRVAEIQENELVHINVKLGIVEDRAKWSLRLAIGTIFAIVGVMGAVIASLVLMI